MDSKKTKRKTDVQIILDLNQKKIEMKERHRAELKEIDKQIRDREEKILSSDARKKEKVQKKFAQDEKEILSVKYRMEQSIKNIQNRLSDN